MNTKVAQLITTLATDKVGDSAVAFAAVMTEKMNTALDERKVAIASEIYNKKQEAK